MPNPFVIDVPAPPPELINRGEELKRLLDLAEGGHNSRLVGPRRYGKTTLLERLGEEASRLDLDWVYVDFFGVLTLADVAARIDRAYSAALKGPLAAWYAGVRRRWRVRGRAGTKGTGLELESLTDAAADERLHELLALPRKMFERTGRVTLIAFDEFQAILAAADSADAVIRSEIQHHRHEAAYVFAGSHPGLLAELFGAKERPLYGQAREIKLAPLGDDDLAEYIDARFRATGREVGDGLEDLLDLARGHPQRAMLLAHHLWELVSAGEAGSPERVEEALVSALSELQESFERYWERLSTNERRVLSAVAWIGKWGAGDSLYANSTLERFRLSKGTARDVSRELLRSGELMAANGGGSLELVDPLLEAWIASDRRTRL